MHSLRHLLSAAGVRALARLTALLALAALPVSAEIIGVEQFDYPENTALGTQSGGSFWDWKNTAPTGHTGTKSNWDYIGFGGPAYITGGRLLTNNHGWVKREYNGNTETSGAINDLNVAKTLFARVTVTTGATLPSYFGFASYDFANERFFLGKRTTGNFGYEIIGGASANGSASPTVNSTFTLVMQLDFAIGTIRLFKNPRLDLPMTNAFNLTPDVLVANATYNATHWSTALRLASGDGGDPILWDDLVVATTWEDLSTTVTTTADEDNGSLSPAAGGGAGLSLREAVKYSPHGIITFAPALSGKTITLNHVDGDIRIDRSLTVDATALPGGIILNGGNAQRIMTNAATGAVRLSGLSFTGGNGVSPEASGNAGAFFAADFTRTEISRCTFFGNNVASNGGALMNLGIMTLTDSVFYDNHASAQGGALQNEENLTMIGCTLTGNTAGSYGGGIESLDTLSVRHSTICYNRASVTTAASGGGGVDSFNSAFTLESSIVWGNTKSGSPDDIRLDGVTFNRLGANIVGPVAQFGTVTVTGLIPLNVDPRLSPLGYFGGPVQTMHPLIGSPAIDAAGTTNPGGTDARGFPRFEDGNPDSAGSQLDIGAVEAGPVLRVMAASDAGDNTLRSLLAASVSFGTPGVRITFDPAIFPAQTITLGGTQLAIPATRSLFIDASNLTISGNNQSGVFSIPATATVAMHSVKITGGRIPDGDFGAGVQSRGRLTMADCTISGNQSSGAAGGVSNAGTLLMDRCTISGNTAATGFGGVLNNPSSTAVLTGCTICGNQAPADAGFLNFGTLSLRHCTVSGNTASSVGGGGRNAGTTPVLRLHHTIIAGNTASSEVDLANVAGGIVTPTGVNLIGIADSTLTTVFPAGQPNAQGNYVGTAATPLNALLAPLGSYGGPTQTMPPLAGSPAIDAAGATSTFTTDQRGRARVVDGNNSGTAQTDIGAVESAIRFVTNNGNSGSGSLRQAVLDAAAAPGWEAIAFVPALNAGTISLTSTDPTNANTGIVITDTDGVAIDASSLPGGLTITKPAGNWRLFRVGDGSRLSLHQLTLTGGSLSGDLGGAVNNFGGTLSLSDCTLTGNTAMDGGAIFSNGASIASGHFTEVRRCTFTGNTATGTGPNGRGGAIFNNNGKTTVLFSTISGNTVPGTSGGGIGSLGDTFTLTEVTSSIVSGNTGGDVVFTTGATNSFLSRGHNLIGTGNGNPAFNQTGDIINNADPLLAPLANYGGPTRTMPPLRGSPAIDASAAASAGPADQRGLPRVVDGNNSGTAQTDIGAVESAFRFVTTTTDNASTPAAGSLRKALIDAAAQPGWEAIAFASSVTPQITLASEILITDPAGVTLDASDRPTGLVIDAGPGTNRHFRIDAGTTAVFQRLKLTGGNGVGTGAPANYGGSIYNGGTLTLRECTLSGNTASNVGGAIYSGGNALTIERSTLHGNSATGGGGAIHHESLQTLTLTASTLANNTAGFEAGAISAPFGRPVLLDHCTISGNRVLNTGASGVGGVRGVPSGSVTVRDSIISGNIDPNASGTPDINAGFTSPGTNIIGGDARLAPLADYGGPTPTMALRPGSPARNTATGTPAATSDQRGFPSVGLKDIGAYEAGTAGNIATTLAETLPNTGPASSVTPEADYDSDGSSNQDEIIAGTLPANASSVFRPTFSVAEPGFMSIIYPSVTGRTYTLQQSDTLAAGSWTNVGSSPGNGALKSFRVPTTAPARRFYRVAVSR